MKHTPKCKHVRTSKRGRKFLAGKRKSYGSYAKIGGPKWEQEKKSIEEMNRSVLDQLRKKDAESLEKKKLAEIEKEGIAPTRAFFGTQERDPRYLPLRQGLLEQFKQGKISEEDYISSLEKISVLNKPSEKKVPDAWKTQTWGRDFGMSPNWIQKSKMKKGALSKQLGIKEEKNIPSSLLDKIISAKAGDTIKNPTKSGKSRIKVTRKLERRAILARNLKSFGMGYFENPKERKGILEKRYRLLRRHDEGPYSDIAFGYDQALIHLGLAKLPAGFPDKAGDPLSVPILRERYGRPEKRNLGMDPLVFNQMKKVTREQEFVSPKRKKKMTWEELGIRGA